MDVLGIDPGADGAATLLFGGSKNFIISRAFKNYSSPLDCLRDLSNEQAMHTQFDSRRLAVVIEQVSSSPQMGVSSAFKFGSSHGYLIGVCSVLFGRENIMHITPRKWHSMLCKKEWGETPKDRSKALALSLWGQDPFMLPRARKPHDGMMDSACIALAAKRIISGEQ